MKRWEMQCVGNTQNFVNVEKGGKYSYKWSLQGSYRVPLLRHQCVTDTASGHKVKANISILALNQTI
jgi:hypothetical protein